MNEPKTLDELITSTVGHGILVQITPYFSIDHILKSVGLWFDNDEGEYELVYTYVSPGYWRLSSAD